MKTGRGRPKKKLSEVQSLSMLIRVRLTEKVAFKWCADLGGISLSSWVRDRLRLVAITELENARIKVPFLWDEKEDDRIAGEGL